MTKSDKKGEKFFIQGRDHFIQHFRDSFFQ